MAERPNINIDEVMVVGEEEVAIVDEGTRNCQYYYYFAWTDQITILIKTEVDFASRAFISRRGNVGEQVIKRLRELALLDMRFEVQFSASPTLPISEPNPGARLTGKSQHPAL